MGMSRVFPPLSQELSHRGGGERRRGQETPTYTCSSSAFCFGSFLIPLHSG